MIIIMHSLSMKTLKNQMQELDESMDALHVHSAEKLDDQKIILFLSQMKAQFEDEVSPRIMEDIVLPFKQVGHYHSFLTERKRHPIDT
jgi:hypothetical protein